MQNIEIEIDADEILTLRVDLKKECGFTAHGKSMRIASSEGNLQLWKDGAPHSKSVRVNLNVFRSLTEKEKREADLHRYY